MTTGNTASFAGKRVTVMGLGRFGGGVAVTRWLAKQGAAVTVSDAASEEQLKDSISQLDDCIANGSVRLALGSHKEQHFAEADFVVANPAVPKPWENRFLGHARQHGVSVTTEIRLLAEIIPDGVTTIGITGSAGKSTTSAMIAHALRSQYKETAKAVWFGGNIGGSLLDDAARMKPGDVVVLELSSAMLYWLSGSSFDDGTAVSTEAEWRPDIGVLTSIAPNHIDWHGSLSHYVRSKSQIGHATQRVHAMDTPTTRECLAACDRARYVSQQDVDVVPVDLLHVPGEHNRANAMLAATVVAGVTECGVSEALQSLSYFSGLADRLQRIDAPGGIVAYNDSKSTTPEATVLAVQAVKQSHPDAMVHLIAGGYDKGVSLDAIAALAIDGEIDELYPIGTTGSVLADNVSCKDFGTLENAVSAAFEQMQPSDVLLLSPGCASWDQFDDYRQRGQRFIELVQQRVPESANTLRA
ncbi:MAG: UDP-N-acetylmuramoyl-L-alanine--D-glutamate ligase [Phycisphaeraceae bacterium]|nr:UDP-N-acetylmuramoyl-L-alanine--D-glutamate ligase [Phycisphaerales bacterium]MCB9861427.1 UDP-N-acetylmuramoyl-L-alanine--D-glutamate ligase [Phycisphaeraceae bacterium]